MNKFTELSFYSSIHLTLSVLIHNYRYNYYELLIYLSTILFIYLNKETNKNDCNG